jgi:hypothetical protein
LDSAACPGVGPLGRDEDQETVVVQVIGQDFLLQFGLDLLLAFRQFAAHVGKH